MHQTFNPRQDDYVDFLQIDQSNLPLSMAVHQQFEQAIIAVEAESPSLQQAVIDNPDTVEQAYNEVKALLILFKVDM
ncbi:MAG: hypothetical protein AAF629_23980 [Chloroflexota bacterium]